MISEGSCDTEDWRKKCSLCGNEGLQIVEQKIHACEYLITKVIFMVAQM